MNTYYLRCCCPCGCVTENENELIGNTGCLGCSQGDHDMHQVALFVEKPAAKSSTSVLKASVCQKCGCKLDGKTLIRPCDCRCHKDGPR